MSRLKRNAGNPEGGIKRLVSRKKKKMEKWNNQGKSINPVYC